MKLPNEVKYIGDIYYFLNSYDMTNYVYISLLLNISSKKKYRHLKLYYICNMTKRLILVSCIFNKVKLLRLIKNF
ncbi:hypothetical protein PFBG_04169 [Plasmodium falciparum 7G8]|uniref:Uncharacterized protein n=2 Tax=Plasmodium falciparum TaxID=5833 RepID=A0A024V4G1_PLAFA|nr:hypothetical protein PFFVO_03718 [Plasmodium falciparum Vietnam Oak-Knoll (FVO)]EUR67489.1 hypothetical protein PFBG_04169 [Plasmodium falciparum 7G8]